MKPTTQQKSREQEAWDEVGHTDIRRGPAWAMTLLFLASIFAVPLHQLAHEWNEARETQQPFRPVALELARELPATLTPLRERGLRLDALLDSNRLLLAEINAYEDRMEDESAWGQFVRPRLQRVFSQYLGVGNEQAYIGNDRWLFYRPGMDYVTGPGFLHPRQLKRRAASGSEWQAAPRPDPRPAILDFHRQLAERGITLVLMPTPVKPSVHPEQFSDRFHSFEGTLQNESYAAFIEEIKKAGVTVFEPEGGERRSEVGGQRAEVRDRRAEGGMQYLATDTHWRPETMEAVAAQLAAQLRPYLSKVDTIAWQREPVTLTARGDIASMLDLPEHADVFPPERVTIHMVTDDAGQFWRPSGDAEVLALGDSFSNIYSLEPMGWGESAGLIEQLAYELGAPVDRMVRNDSGAYATRERLSQAMARGEDPLKGKRVVVWQFAARELSVGDWRIIPLEKKDAPPATFYVPEEGEQIKVTGVVRSASRVPRPGAVPYKDHIMALHVTDLPGDAQAVVYVQSMRDQVWTSAARLRENDEVTLLLRPWSDVASAYDGINRSELEDFALQLQEPCWGEMLED